MRSESRVPSLKSQVIAVLLLAVAVSGFGDEGKGTNGVAVIAPVTVQSGVSSRPTVRLNRQIQTNVQERLQPTSPDKLIERHGAIGAIFARPDKVKPLQLLNPLAPREYGGVGDLPARWSWDPLVGPGQGPRPRGFQDDRFHEASGVILNHSFR